MRATPLAEAVQAPHDAARDWAGLSGRWGQQHSAMPEALRVEHAEAKAEIDRLTAALDCERVQANEWLFQLHDAQAQLKAIAAALDADPERSPAWGDNDQPIPLPRRVEVALMPEGPGNTWIERKIMGHLDSYGVPTERNGITLTLASRVAVAAEGWRDHVADAGKMVNG